MEANFGGSYQVLEHGLMDNVLVIFFFFQIFSPFQSSFSSFSSLHDSLCLIALLEGGKNLLIFTV